MRPKTFLLIFVSFILASLPQMARAQASINIWKEFVASLKRGEITSDKIRPHYENMREPIMGILKTLRQGARWEEWEAEPEIYQVGSQITYLLPLKFGGNKETTWSFTILTESGTWYLRQIENIFVRLDKTPPLPTSTFPDIPEAQKAWAREEIFWSKQVYLFNVISKEKRKKFALNLFKDGGGYFLGAKTWVPFIPASRAFILYLCWEQANLRGNKVTLEKLEDNEAIVKMRPTYFLLYKQTTHLKQQISFEDYRLIFETIWQDRATNAGWNLEIQYAEDECVFHFRKTS